MLPSHAAECDYCGHKFRKTPRTGPEFKDGELSEVKQKKWTQADKRALFTTLMAKARSMGHKPGWASRAFKRECKVWPRGFVTQVKEESFDKCMHERVNDDDRCNHCGEYCGPDAGSY